MADNAVTVADIQIVMSYRTKGNPQKQIDKTKKSLKELGEQSGKAEKSGNKLFASLKRIATYRLLRTALKAIGQSFKEGITNLVAWDKAFANTSGAAKTMAELSSIALKIKNTLGATLMPVIQAALPIIRGMANVFIAASNAANQFFRALQGYGTYIKAKTVENDAYADSIKDVKRQLLGFDELNRLSDNNSGGNAANVTDMFEETQSNSRFQKLAETAKESTQVIKDNLDKIKVACAAAPLAVGILLALNGELMKGIPLIALGVAGLAASLSGGSIEDKVLKGLSTIKNAIVALAGGALVLGVILTLFGGAGSLPLGIGLIAAGAGILGSAVVIQDGTIPIQEKLTKLSAILGASAFALGAVLFFSGVKPGLGLGLMLGGAAALGTAVAINWDWIGEKVQGLLDGIKTKVNSWVSWWKGTELYKLLYGNAPTVSMPLVVQDTSTPQKLLDALNPVRTNQLTGQKRFFTPYANGGFPAQGSMFIAGEAGAEFVGNIGGRTGVYNTDQMAGALASANMGVENAVYEMANAIVNAINNQPVPSIKIGDREIYQSAERGRRTIGGSLVQGV